MTIADALAIAQAVRKGEARLRGCVVFHKREMRVSVPWEPVQGNASAVLAKYREWLRNGLERRLQTMEESGWENLSEDEYSRFCSKYGEYYRLLEVMKHEEMSVQY